MQASYYLDVLNLREIRDERSEILHQIDRLSDESGRLGANMRDEIAGLKKEVIDTIRGLRTNLESEQLRNSSITRTSKKSTGKSPAIGMGALAAALA